jgi:hypothetical protein
MRVAAARRAHGFAGASSSPLVVAAVTALASASVALAASSTPCVIQGSSIGKFDLRELRNKKRESLAVPPPSRGRCSRMWGTLTRSLITLALHASLQMSE